MPRRAHGPRLYLERAELDASGRLTRHATWVIRDRSRKVRTGCREDEAGDAEQRLATYIAEKYQPARALQRDPSQIFVADVIDVYDTDVADKQARPSEVRNRLTRVNEHFGSFRLSDINGAECRRYVEKRGQGIGRRELEDLRAAVNHYHKEGFVTSPVAITLPERGQAREKWLTRSEAAKLLWTAWRHRDKPRVSKKLDAPASDSRRKGRRAHRHVARFILVALYTGTRAGAVCGAAIRPTVGRGYVDLDRGVFYRRPPGARETKKRQPPAPLPNRLLAHLRRWERKKIAKQSVIEWRGRPVGKINKAFRAVREEAGFDADVIPHTLRHTAATWLMQNGCDPWSASGFLGMSMETLIRVYGHHSPDHLEQAKQLIAAPGHNRDRNTGTEREHRSEKGSDVQRKSA